MTHRNVFPANRPYESECWAPGETHYIPRVYGPGYDCLITDVTREYVRFDGPWGPSMISHRLIDAINNSTAQHSRASTRPEETLERAHK